MKTIALEQVDQRISDALMQQRSEEPILLTKGAEGLALVLRLPEGSQDWDVDSATWVEEPQGNVSVFIEVKHRRPAGSENGATRPVFGSCQGMMTTVAEDEEHLQDFQEYMQ